MDDVDAAELAVLRERAYGAGAGELSPGDAARLRDLERRRRTPGPAGPDAPSSSTDARGEATREPGAPDARGAAPGEPAASDVDDATASTAPRPGRSGVTTVLLVVAAALIPVAAVTGYLAAASFAGPSAAPSPTAILMSEGLDATVREAHRKLALDVEEWDDGVDLWGAADDVTVWWGVAGAATCAVVVSESQGPVPICADTDVARTEGLREEIEFVQVDADASAGTDTFDVSDVPSTRIVFAGNPYTGQLMLLRDAPQP